MADFDSSKEYASYREQRAQGILNRIQNAAGTNCSLIIIDDSNPQAYANGQNLAITTGAIDRLNDDELAFGLAHEIVHNLKRHPQRSEEMENVLKRAPDLFSFICTSLFVQYRERCYEHGADEEAKSLMNRAGFNSESAASAMQKFDSNNEGKGGLFHNHPSTDERIKRLNNNK